MPTLGRRLIAHRYHDVELIYGARRLFVARHLNASLLVEMRDLTDSEAIIALDIENRQRADVTPYERGMSHKRWMRAGHFTSHDELARALHISTSQVSRLRKLASLPAVIVDAFENPRPPTKDVYGRLLAASSRGRKVKASAHDEVVKDVRGAHLFRIKRHRPSLAFVVPIERVSASRLALLRETLANLLSQDAARSSSADRNETEICIVSDDTRHRSARIAGRSGELAVRLPYDEVRLRQQ